MLNTIKKAGYVTLGTFATSAVFASEAATLETLAAPDTSSIENAMILAGGALIGLAITFGGIRLVINMIRSGVSGGR